MDYKHIVSYFLLFCYVAHIIVMFLLSDASIFFILGGETQQSHTLYGMFICPLVFIIFIFLLVAILKLSNDRKYQIYSDEIIKLNVYEKTFLIIFMSLHSLVAVGNIFHLLFIVLLSLLFGNPLALFSLLFHIILLGCLIFAIDQVLDDGKEALDVEF